MLAILPDKPDRPPVNPDVEGLILDQPAQPLALLPLTEEEQVRESLEQCDMSCSYQQRCSTVIRTYVCSYFCVLILYMCNIVYFEYHQ